MDNDIRTLMQACTTASDTGEASFPSIVGRLMGIGVERYDADLCRAEKTYFLSSGASHITPCVPIAGEAARSFSAEKVQAAIRASQSQQITYHEFCRRVLAAGCVGYTVFLTGRRVVYYGRTGDLHTEHFPTIQS